MISPSEPDDDELVSRSLRGSEDALTNLYLRYRPRVIGYVWRMTNDRDLAEEIFCATFAAFFENLSRYRPGGRLVAYLLRIARNRLFDEMKARGRLANPLPTPSLDERSNSLFSPAPPVPDSLITSEEAERVCRAVAQLPEHLREVVVLRLYEDLDYASVAAIVGVGETTVRSRMRYALETLRRALQ